MLQFNDLAEDAFQTTVLRLHEHRAGIASFPQARAWLRTTATRCAREMLRGNRRRYRREKSRAVPPNAADSPDDSGARAELAVALDTLPDEERDAITFRFFEGLTQEEGGAAVGCNRQTFAERVTRGLKRLREVLAATGA